MSDLARDPHLSHGLQEWAVCCRALMEGSITVTVRKGGIHERGGGLFVLEHQRFALLPTHLHQDVTRVLPDYGASYFAEVATAPQPGSIAVGCWAEASRIWKVTDLARFHALGDEMLWTADELARRFAYRDQPWVFVVALRIHRLPFPVLIPDRPHYAGCRSWIPLEDPVPVMDSTAVLDDATHAARLAAIARLLVD